jgi:hypothetical protein
MNRGTYGYPLPPNYATTLVPPRWTNARAYTVAGAYTGFVVPANVFQIGLMVVGAGGSGAMATASTGNVATGGGGGGFAFGILDVTPGQVLPTITVGAGGAALNTVSNTNGNSGGTSSFGTIVTCTGGSGGSSPNVQTNGTGGAGGTATVTGLRNSVASTGGRGGTVTSAAIGYKTTGGGAAGGFFASGNGGDLIPTGGNLEVYATGGAGWGGNGSGINSTANINTSGFAFGGGAFNFNGASFFNLFGNQAGPGAGTAGSGFYTRPVTTNSSSLGGNGIIGSPTQPLVPVATAATYFTIQPAAGSGFLSSNASNPYLMLVDLNFGGAGGNSYVNASTTANIYAAGNGGNGGGGGGFMNAGIISNGIMLAGDGGMCGGGGAMASVSAIASAKSGSGGFFGGGGALSTNASTDFASAGDGGNGGGGGGISVASNTVRVSGAGGAGAVILFWTDGY